MLGEIHRCERCRALSPALSSNGKLSCAACGAAREPRLGLTIVSEADHRRALRRGQLTPFLMFAGAALAGAAGLSVAALLGAGAQSVGARGLAAALGLGSLACAAALAWTGRTQLERAVRKHRFELEQRVVGLAYQHHGRLEARMVSESLPLSVAAAEAFLTELTHVGRARIETGENGRITYVFPDAKPTRGIRVRKDPTGSIPP